MRNFICSILGIVFAVACLPVQAQSLSNSEAGKLISNVFRPNTCGVLIPVGVHEFAVPEAAQGGSRYELAQNAIAMKELDIVIWRDMQSMIGMVKFQIAVNPAANASEIGKNQNGIPCIILRSGEADVSIVSITPVRGGNRTSWDGSVVLARVKQPYTGLYLKYAARRRLSVIPDLRLRLLVRVDPFTKEWRMIGADHAPYERDFTTNNVSAELAKD